MSDTVNFEDRGQFVYCRYTGPFALEPTLNLAKEVSEYCKSHDYERVLVDISESEGTLGDFDRFKHGTATSNLLSPKLKIAIVGSEDQKRGNFWETVTRNRNLKTKVFHDLKLAEEWLCL
jgi:hypothetical protein